MGLIQEGILLGLVLTASIGPIFFTLVQVSLRNGFAAGLFVGTGIWISDIIYISSIYVLLTQLNQLQESETFSFWFAIIGGLILIGFGIYLFLKKPPSLEELKTKRTQGRSLAGLWLQGFLVNTANPFTFFFWMTTMTDGVVKRGFQLPEIFLFFGAIIGTIIITDSLKVFFADKIRQRLLPRHLRYFAWLAGLIISGFGLTILLRGLN